MINRVVRSVLIGILRFEIELLGQAAKHVGIIVATLRSSPGHALIKVLKSILLSSM